MGHALSSWCEPHHALAAPHRARAPGPGGPGGSHPAL